MAELQARPITDRQLAALLKEHKIKPKTVRRGDVTEKGYRLEWFEDVFARYLPSHPSQRHKPVILRVLTPFDPSHRKLT